MPFAGGGGIVLNLKNTDPVGLLFRPIIGRYVRFVRTENDLKNGKKAAERKTNNNKEIRRPDSFINNYEQRVFIRLAKRRPCVRAREMKRVRLVSGERRLVVRNLNERLG